MKTKIKTKKVLNYCAYTLSLVFVIVLINSGVVKLSNLAQNTIYSHYAYASVNFKAPAANEKEYEYNERVPVKAVRLEIAELEKRFNIRKGCMDTMVKCESGYNNLVRNPKSTALGVGQYLIGTWQETESYKQFKIARTDYKPVLFEMAMDINAGESWRWEESIGCWSQACK